MAVRKRQAPSKTKRVRPPLSVRLLPAVERRAFWIAAALILLASARIVATYSVFNHTYDEPAHIACGMEWLDRGVYQWEPQHPPLARVAAALPLYLAGLRSHNTRSDLPFAMWQEGAAILYSANRYDRNLELARLGILPFFWLACAVVYVWGARYFRPAVALAAIFLFSMLPPVLAHSGVATTDMALTATMALAFFAGMRWLEQPSFSHAAWFGAATGVMTLSKFSALVFFPASAALAVVWYLATERPGRAWLAKAAKARALSFGLAVLTGALVIWAGYRFSFGDAGFLHLRLPAPELYAGIRQVMEHNALGQASYLLGTYNHTGFWLFFPVALAVKSPLGFLILVMVALVLAFRKQSSDRNLRVLVAYSAGILFVAVFSRIDIGIRHVLPMYVALSLLSAVTLVHMIEWSDTRRWLHAAVGLLVLWIAGSSLLSHPDYLAYFNELAGSEPEKILVDSDLDWGQDLKRLAARLHDVGATDVTYDPYMPGDVEKELGFPRIHRMNPDAPSPGWNAIGAMLWKESNLIHWPDRIPPQERVGKSIFLWYFAPTAPNLPQR